MKKGLFSLLEIFFRFVVHPRLRARLLGLAGATIGNNVRIYEGQWINLENGFSNLIIEDDVFIGPGYIIDLEGKVVLRKGAVLSPAVKIISHQNPGSQHMSPICDYYPVQIGTVEISSYCWIGTSATILHDVSICAYTVIAAGSVVVNDINQAGLYAGIPSKFIKNLEPAHKSKFPGLGHKKNRPETGGVVD